MKYVEGNLIKLALEGEFDVITHGCNCFCTMGAGIAVPMKQAFGCDKFKMEDKKYRGNINKLGIIDWEYNPALQLIVINSYTQYRYGRNHANGAEKPIDYEALTLCLRKINHIFKGKKIGLPLIGAGLAGGDWNIIEKIIEKELKDMDVTIVKFKNN